MIAQNFAAQDQLFIPGPALLLSAEDPYRLFAKVILPVMIKARRVLASFYCASRGRPCVEPVRLMALCLLQFWERVPDAKAVAMLNWHLGWAFAVGWPMGAPLFHPCVLSRFRKKLLQHQQAALVFEELVKELIRVGLMAENTSRRLDSTYVLGLVSHRGRLECVRETVRLALQELDLQVPAQARLAAWRRWWERYVELQFDYRAEPAVMDAKLAQAGQDIAELLAWLESAKTPWAAGAKVQLLRRVFAENFQLRPACPPSAPSAQSSAATPMAVAVETPVPVPKEKNPAGAVKNPHDPDAQWASKGSGAQKKQVVGYKVQVCETVQEQPLAKGQPTPQFLTAIETQLATASDERGMVLVEAAQARMSLPPPPTTYVDAAYVSGPKLAEARDQGRELIGPVPAPPSRDGRYSAADFEVTFDPLQARCPAGHLNASSMQWQDGALGGLATRFDWKDQCQHCPQRLQCISPSQSSRTLAIGPYHELLQRRRREQTTPEFQARCQHRNALEGTQSELVRSHGLRHARYRGLQKVRLQNYFIGAACNAKRWIRQLQWQARLATPEVCPQIEKN